MKIQNGTLILENEPRKFPNSRSMDHQKFCETLKLSITCTCMCGQNPLYFVYILKGCRSSDHFIVQMITPSLFIYSGFIVNFLAVHIFNFDNFHI